MSERTFQEVLNEWTDTVLKENREAKEAGEILLVQRLGLLGQRLLFEAHLQGADKVVDMLKDAKENSDVPTISDSTN